jgi:two-component system sensor histidine kinase BaeS
VPLRRSLLVRLLASSLLVALCAITATAWLAVRTTTSAIRQEQGQVLSDDTDIYKTLTDYAAGHPSWDGVAGTVRHLADRTNRRIALIAQDQGHRTIADSAPSASPLPDQAFAVIDPLQVDPALFPHAAADRIDPRVLGPFLLSAAQRRHLLKGAKDIKYCLGPGHFDTKISFSASGHPFVDFADNSFEASLVRAKCEFVTKADLATPGELKALDSLNQLIKNCLTHQGLPVVRLDLRLIPKPGTDIPAAQSCIASSRREQLAAYVAPAAQLFVSEPAGSAVPGFDLSQANTVRPTASIPGRNSSTGKSLD